MQLVRIVSIVFIVMSVMHAAYEQRQQQSLIARAIGTISKQKPFFWMQRSILRRLHASSRSMLLLEDKAALEEYQRLGKEAQDALMIPVDQQLPIKTISSHSILRELVAAIAEPDAIYVNEAKLAASSYGRCRMAMFHEAVHVKYHDITISSIVDLSSMIGSAYLLHKITQRLPLAHYRKLRWLLIAILASATCQYATARYRRFMEWRADIEGSYATACYHCVMQAAAHRRELFAEAAQGKSSIVHNGYLSAEELEQIAARLAQQHQACAYHQGTVDCETCV
ncbi:hypothetical protein M1466_01705 [Candidatus Dependentiae bacterium]|nr:hypothetical protein [Candidatus Dependentiae bacterium]